jgi:hypothetical protein
MESKSITEENSKTPMELIKEERQRQIDKGYTTLNDQAYGEGELFKAACCYSSYPYVNANSYVGGVLKGWPWEAIYWKPSPDNRLKDLVKAGALYLAHVELTGEEEGTQPFTNQVLEEIEQVLTNPSQTGIFTHCPACHTIVTHTELHKNPGGVCNECIALLNG